MSPIVNKLSLQEFLDSPKSGDRNEFVDGVPNSHAVECFQNGL